MAKEPNPSSAEELDHPTSEHERRTQVDITERLQLKWLTRMEYMIDNGLMSSTDMATLARFLMQNGWNVDPARMPKGIRDKLTTHFSAEDLDDDDVIVGTISKRA